jgi:hypothetical protein
MCIMPVMLGRLEVEIAIAKMSAIHKLINSVWNQWKESYCIHKKDDYTDSNDYSGISLP